MTQKQTPVSDRIFGYEKGRAVIWKNIQFANASSPFLNMPRPFIDLLAGVPQREWTIFLKYSAGRENRNLFYYILSLPWMEYF